MPLVCYIPRAFYGTSIRLINLANEIVDDYERQSLSLTLRQLYYQLVARGHIPNNLKSYKVLQSVINDARLAGKIDWNAIEDRTRYLRKTPSWSSPLDILNSCANQYREDIWDDQPRYIEVWVEKDALIGVVEKACDPWRVPYFSCRGYTSQSDLWRAAMRLVAKAKPCVVIHLGDHDPSGLDMSRDMTDRLQLYGATDVELRRIALNIDQVREYNPPPNPAKETDSRGPKYVEEFGTESWELDALEPQVLIDLIHHHIEDVRDVKIWDKSIKKEARGRKNLATIADNYDRIIDLLK